MLGPVGMVCELARAFRQFENAFQQKRFQRKDGCGSRRKDNLDQIEFIIQAIYTAKFGLLTERYSKSGYTIAMHRIASEIATSGTTTATLLASILAMDRAQISRILSRMLSLGLVEKAPDDWNAKRQLIKLSDQ